MKFLRTLLLPLLSILLASGNQVLSNLDNPLLGVSSNVKHTAKTGENAEVCAKQGTASTGLTKVVSEEIKSLPVVRTKLSPHCLERCAERDITKKMAEKVLEKGLRFYDPLNKSIVYVLRNGMGSGKHITIATEPSSGLLKTVYLSRPGNLPKRYIPLD